MARKPCRYCPETGDCSRCGYPGVLREYLAETPTCACGAKLQVRLDARTRPVAHRAWFVECSRFASLLGLLRGGNADDHTFHLVATSWRVSRGVGAVTGETTRT